MKILYASGSTIPSFDANSVNVVNMCYSFGLDGHDVTIIANRGSEKIKVDFFQFYALEQNEKVKLAIVKRGRFAPLKRLFILGKNIKQNDLVFTRWVPAAFISAVIFRKKTIIEYHSYSKRKLTRLINYLTIKFGNVVRFVFITQSLANTYIDIYPEIYNNYKVLPGGANRLVDFKRETVFKYSCGYVGSFKEGKGVDTVIKIAKQIPNVQFHIIGGNENEIEELKRKVGNPPNIIWYGYLPFSEAQKKMGNFDIALLPNKEKVMIETQDIGSVTSPNKMFEYMANNKIIIASNIEVLREVLVNRENSLLVESENIDEWVNSINLVGKDVTLREYIRDNSYNTFMRKYSWFSRSQKALEGIEI